MNISICLSGKYSKQGIEQMDSKLDKSLGIDSRIHRVK